MLQTFDALFDLFDADGNGAIDMKECVQGLSALSMNTSEESTLQWLFEVFRCFTSALIYLVLSVAHSDDGRVLFVEDLERLVQFVSIVANAQKRYPLEACLHHN